MGRLALAAAGAVLLVVILVAGAAAGIASMFGLGSTSAPSQAAAADIPPDYLALDIQAAGGQFGRKGPARMDRFKRESARRAFEDVGPGHRGLHQ